MTQHEQDVKELFDKVTVPVPGSDKLHAITFESFTTAVEWIMTKGYYLGQQEGLNKASAIVQETFAHPI